MSLQVVRIKGIPIRLHFTLIVVFFLITWTLATYFMPQIYPGLNTIEYWVMGAIGAAVLFISVLLHELAHSIIATRYGLKVRQIVLFIFGGVSDIEEEEQITKAKGVLFYAAIVNILLGSFNLIPAFPLDGGRILRAGLVKWKKDYDQAT